MLLVSGLGAHPFLDLHGASRYNLHDVLVWIDRGATCLSTNTSVRGVRSSSTCVGPFPRLTRPRAARNAAERTPSARSRCSHPLARAATAQRDRSGGAEAAEAVAAATAGVAATSSGCLERPPMPAPRPKLADAVMPWLPAWQARAVPHPRHVACLGCFYPQFGHGIIASCHSPTTGPRPPRRSHSTSLLKMPTLVDVSETSTRPTEMCPRLPFVPWVRRLV